LSSDLRTAVQARLDSLTKPPGSLGRLEEIVLRYCLATGEVLPPPPRKGLFVFCADHGVTAEGVSPYPSEVTRQMMLNFARGGAAINVLCRQFEIDCEVVDMGVGASTSNFAVEPAMSRGKAEAVIRQGRFLARSAAARHDLLAAGEMGIGNTTSAAAIAAVMLGRDPRETSGAGTGLDSAGIEHKAAVISQALALHRPTPEDPVGVLAAVGGFEIGAMAGFYIGCAESRRPFVVDGFIASSAMLLARSLHPSVTDFAFFGHRSAERGASLVLDALEAQPILSLDMRLGEGTGAALAIGVIEAALRLYREMATFVQAGVSSVQ
jgi:nicotinate-nucleotide--dimethylbenzimidazole phosphoribosyltransferase